MLKETVSIEVQGFFDKNNNFILKEIGIVFEEDPNLNNSFLIEPPYDFTLLNTKSRKTAIWLTNTHHKEKRFLQTFFGSRQLINVEEMGGPSLNRFKGNRFPYCETHLKGGVCALNNAYIILTFFKSSSKTIK